MAGASIQKLQAQLAPAQSSQADQACCYTGGVTLRNAPAEPTEPAHTQTHTHWGFRGGKRNFICFPSLLQEIKKPHSPTHSLSHTTLWKTLNFVIKADYAHSEITLFNMECVCLLTYEGLYILYVTHQSLWVLLHVGKKFYKGFCERSELTRPLQPAPHLCLRLAAHYISRYQHNTPESPIKLSVVKLHCG